MIGMYVNWFAVCTFSGVMTLWIAVWYLAFWAMTDRWDWWRL